jgi:hypothetical protein
METERRLQLGSGTGVVSGVMVSYQVLKQVVFTGHFIKGLINSQGIVDYFTSLLINGSRISSATTRKPNDDYFSSIDFSLDDLSYYQTRISSHPDLLFIEILADLYDVSLRIVRSG